MREMFKILLCAGFLLASQSAFASPVFSARDNLPLSAAVETPESETDAPKENVSPESTWSNREGQYALSEIRVKVLAGLNQDGGKANSVAYSVVETSEATKLKVEPAVIVTYKNRADENQFTVKKIFVKVNPTNSSLYKITAEIIEEPNDKNIPPEVVFV